MEQTLRKLSGFFLAVLLALYSTSAHADAVVPAPEFEPGLPWLNVAQPLSMKKLRGKAVLLDFWTYGCINCMHVIPDLKRLEAKYGNRLAVIGVHSPKFDNEKNLATLRNIVVRYGLEHPVVNDVDFSLWKQYGVSAWPTQVLVDPAGNVVGGVSGEGQYETLDRAIGEVLGKFAGRLDTRPLPIVLEKKKLTLGFLAAPGKIAASRDRVAIADTLHHRIVVTDGGGKVLLIFGSGKEGLRDGPAQQARFLAPQGLAFAEGGLYVADTGNHAIRYLDFAAKTVKTVAGNGKREWRVKGEADALGAGLDSPWDVQVRGDELFIAMAGTHQIWRMDLKTRRIGPYAGSGRENITDGSFDQAAFSQPSGLALAGDWLYVADAEDSGVRRLDLRPRHHTVETLVGSGLFDFGDRDGPFRSAKLQHVLGIAALDEHRIAIADTYNHKLKLLDLDARTVTTLAGTGKPGKGTGSGLQAMLNEPGGVAVRNGKLLIADTNNHRIVEFDPATRVLQAWPVRE